MPTRDRNNYPDLVIAPYQDPNTRAIYPAAVYTNGMFSVSNRNKELKYEVDVYASIEAFEEGGAIIGTPISRTITSGVIPPNPLLPDYETVILNNATLVGGVLQVLAQLEEQINNPFPVEE